jgi:hypothetical protein
VLRHVAHRTVPTKEALPKNVPVRDTRCPSYQGDRTIRVMLKKKNCCAGIDAT